MDPTLFRPSLGDLQNALAAALVAGEDPDHGLEILHRRPSPQISSFPAEVVDCRTPEGTTLTLLCKYGVGHTESGFGHRGGVPYEARVYRNLLSSLPKTTARFYGSFNDPSTDSTWLFIEFLRGAARIAQTERPAEYLLAAANWIGSFHALTTRFVEDCSANLVNAYNTDFFEGWARRTVEHAARWSLNLSWLEEACEGFLRSSSLLSVGSNTIIHGEFYPKNIVAVGNDVYPVDWESAAIAAGEIDLAALTEGWEPELVSKCELEYQRARWPNGAPEDFRKRLAIARVYLPLRWLGDSGTGFSGSWYIETLRQNASLAGLIQ
jgi:hypothetical protein